VVSTTTSPRTGIEIHLAARPRELAGLDAFEEVRVAVPDPAPGEVLVRNEYLSLDPGMLLRMSAPDLPLPMYEVGEVLHGDAIGKVIASADPRLAVGDVVVHQLGWREYAVAAADAVRRVDADAYPSLSMHLGFGLVAYSGLLAVAGMRPGDTVFVSSAAGSVGGLAGQIARLTGAGRVIGSAGSPEKVRYLTERLGYDAAFDHHDGSPADHLRELAPEGVDVYFDNVGGEQLLAAVEVMNVHGRVALCGALGSQSTGRADPVSLDPLTIIGKRLTLRGFTLGDHLPLAAEFGPRFRDWLSRGEILYDETVLDGLAQAPRGLLDLVRGAYTGKVVVRV
jgi:NADPH-dependent curcumin reductase CurA